MTLAEFIPRSLWHFFVFSMVRVSFQAEAGILSQAEAV